MTPTARRPRAWLALASCLVVLLVAEVGVRVVAAGLPPAPRWPNPFADVKVAQMEALGDAEVVLLGSSIVNAGLDASPVARAFDVGVDAVYNAGLPAAGIEHWEVWHRDVVAPALEPAVVVIGVSIRDYNDTTYSAPNLRSFVASDGYALATGTGDLLTRVDAVASRVSALVRYRSVLRQPGSVLAWRRGEEVPGWPRQEIDARGRYLGFDADGYEPADAERYAELRAGAMADYTPGGRKRAALERLLADVRRSGATPVLVRLPALHASLQQGEVIAVADVATLERDLREVARAADAAFVDAAPLDDRPELFADEYHLNGAGVAQLGRLVAASLDDLGPGVSPGSVGGG